jgi:hypothetical protein
MYTFLKKIKIRVYFKEIHELLTILTLGGVQKSENSQNTREPKFLLLPDVAIVSSTSN